MIRKFISELVGTMLLVIFGCGTAVVASSYLTSLQAGTSLAYLYFGLIIALAFGLVLMALVYTIGKVSGAHVNPAVSVAATIDGRISIFECVYYICAQIAGGILGALVISWLFHSAEVLGANGFKELSALGATITTTGVAFAVEAILTFMFVLVVLSVSKKESCTNGLVIGLALTLVHIIGIPFTGTSVNPARSIGPAILTGGDALSQLWLFIVAPLVGGIIAALFYKFVIAADETQPAMITEVEEIIFEDDEDDDEEDEKPKRTARKTTTRKPRAKKE
jgi:aquaporin Z